MQCARCSSDAADKPCFFAYLSADYPAVHQILAQLVKAGISGEVHVRNAVGALKDHLRASGLIVHDTPQAMGDVLARASFIIHHASLGTAESALWAGCPQLLLPRHLEQKLTAEALLELGVGKYVSGKISMSEIIQTARDLCGHHHAETAAQLANSLHAREATHPLRQVVARCLELL
jgi:UDP:flavonoid glycosyltransferase YjiC (YdhE family)